MIIIHRRLAYFSVYVLDFNTLFIKIICTKRDEQSFETIINSGLEKCLHEGQAKVLPEEERGKDEILNRGKEVQRHICVYPSGYLQLTSDEKTDGLPTNQKPKQTKTNAS